MTSVSASWECPVTAEPFCSDSSFHGNSHSVGLWEVKFSTGVLLTEPSRLAEKKTKEQCYTQRWRGGEAIFEWMSMEKGKTA